MSILRRDTVKSDRVRLNELSMSTSKAPALSALVTLEKEESAETEEGFYLHVTKSASTERQSASEDGKGAEVRGRGLLAQRQGAQW